MRKEIAPELYNYNKFPGKEFRIEGDQVLADGICLSLVENEKDAFDVLSFTQRFSDILLKYDFIVGDWSNEQLRLKGFYKTHHTKALNTIHRLEDYLKEYCSFGCAYFILGNDNPEVIQFEEERQFSKSIRKDQRQKEQKGPRKRQNKSYKSQKERSSTSKKKLEYSQNNSHFVMRKKGKTNA